MRKRSHKFVALMAAFGLGTVIPASASATTATLAGTNGEGVFSDAPACGGGEGPYWRYVWNDGGASSPGGVLSGLWDGAFEVHDAGDGHAFIPNDEGRLAITVDRGGTAFFSTRGDGSCGNATATLATQADGDRVVSGTLPIGVGGGTGAFRGLTGSGVVSFALELGPGADNVADVSFAGDLDVLDPQLSIERVSVLWESRSAFRDRRLTIVVSIANAAGVGDAFDVGVTGADGGTGDFMGLPTAPTPIPAGGSAELTFTMLGAGPPNTTYTIDVTAAGRDGLLRPVPAVSMTASFDVPPPRNLP